MITGDAGVAIIAADCCASSISRKLFRPFFNFQFSTKFHRKKWSNRQRQFFRRLFRRFSSIFTQISKIRRKFIEKRRRNRRREVFRRLFVHFRPFSSIFRVFEFLEVAVFRRFVRCLCPRSSFVVRRSLAKAKKFDTKSLKGSSNASAVVTTPPSFGGLGSSRFSRQAHAADLYWHLTSWLREEREKWWRWWSGCEQDGWISNHEFHQREI